LLVDLIIAIYPFCEYSLLGFGEYTEELPLEIWTFEILRYLVVLLGLSFLGVLVFFSGGGFVLIRYRSICWPQAVFRDGTNHHFASTSLIYFAVLPRLIYIFLEVIIPFVVKSNWLYW
jgi:hypothetical protein